MSQNKKDSRRSRQKPGSRGVHNKPMTASTQEHSKQSDLLTHRMQQQSLATLSETAVDDRMSSLMQYSHTSYQPPNDPAVLASLAELDSYLAATGLERTFNGMCRLLLNRTQLPYNPYPELVRKVRQLAEKFHMAGKSEDILKKLYSKVESSHIGYIVRPPACSHVWGLEGVVKHTEPALLASYQWLMQSVLPERQTLASEDGYSNQVMAALCGPAVFSGTFYNMKDAQVKVKLEYLITGIDVEQGISLYVDSLLSYVKHLNAGGVHLFIGLSLMRQMWPVNDIENEPEEIWELVHDCVVAHHPICAECIFSLDQEERDFRKGVIEFSLNIIQVAEDRSEVENLTTFTETPMMTLHEGVFLQQHYAESYLSIFTPRLDLMDLDRAGEETKAMIEEEEKKFRFKWMKGRKKQDKKKVQVDGFRHREPLGKGPIHKQIREPIRDFLKKKILAFHPQAQCFEVLHCILQLTLVDSENYGPVYKTEIYRMLHGRAARMHSAMDQNRLLRLLVERFKNDIQSTMVDQLFHKYKEDLMSLFDNEYQEQSSDLSTCAAVLAGLLEGLIVYGEDNFPHVSLSTHTVSVLKQMNYYCATVFLQLVEDALIWCPNIQSLIESLKAEFPENIPRIKTGEKQRDPKKKVTRRVDEHEHFTHGTENSTLAKHRHQVLNVDMCIERQSSQKSIAVESVLLKYVVDTHLDEVWKEYLVDLLAGSKLPPNPYPSLVTALRRAAYRMDLMFESDESLCGRLLHGSAREEDPNNFIWHIPGCDAHGLQSALSVLDTSHFFQLAPLVNNFVNSTFNQQRGPYKVALCLAVSGHSTLYGRMSPYLNTLELHENCFIRGPTGCEADARQLYSSIIFHHMWDLYRNQKFPVLGVFMGVEERRWTLTDIADGKKAFAHEFERYCSEKQPLYLKAYMLLGWRYLPVIKYFKLHFTNEEETEKDEFFPYDPASLYQNIFLEREKASFHFEYGGTTNKDNPFNSGNKRRTSCHLDLKIKEAADREDWLAVHKLLLTKNLVNQGTSHVAETWRMLHSVAGQLEYVRLLVKSIQELVSYSLEEEVKEKQDEDASSPPPASQPPADEDDEPQRISNVDMSVLGRMMLATKQKLLEVVQSPSCMAASSVGSVILMRLQLVTQRDVVTKELLPVLEPETVSGLGEVQGMLQALQDIAAADVHAINPAACAAVRSIQAEQPCRPSSVASVQLSDPSVYIPRPDARKDFLDDWTGTHLTVT